MRIWTLTVDNDDDGIVTSVHPSEEDALKNLRDNYDPFDEFDDMQAILDGNGICVYIEEHEIGLCDGCGTAIVPGEDCPNYGLGERHA